MLYFCNLDNNIHVLLCAPCIWTCFPEMPLYMGCGAALPENPLQALQAKHVAMGMQMEWTVEAKCT